METGLKAYARRPIAAALVVLAAGPSLAAQINTEDSDFALRWDNTVKLSGAYRLKAPSAALLGNPNNDDGDRNFGKGLISSRVDLFSEFDAIYQRRIGVRLSGAAYDDAVYSKANDNPGFAGGAFPNQTSVAYNRFPNATRDLHGRKAELLDAFVFARFDLGDMQGSVRAGRHAILWGESLFLGSNAISGGQQPVDIVKLTSVPNTQFKEAILPVPQVSGQLQLNSSVSVAAYVQTAFEPSRVPGVGSYFSNADPAVVGGENLILAPGVPFAQRQADFKPKSSGQGGLQLKVRGDEADYGFYAIRFHAKSPQLVPLIVMTPVGPTPGGYYMAYQQGITALGASVSRTFDNFNVAIEVSTHRNQDLASTQGADLSAFTPAPKTNITDNPGYAVGNTAHINLSTIGSFGPSALWREANLAAEIAWNRVLSISKNAAARDPNATRDGVAARIVLEPVYRGVFDGIDIGVPIGLGYAPKGSRPLAISNPNGWIAEGGGDVSLGVNASINDAWRATFSYTHYHGKAATFNDLAANNAYSWKQTYKDRDFLAVSLRYSF
jgi:Protein of unknown function (DUF1302)